MLYQIRCRLENRRFRKRKRKMSTNMNLNPSRNPNPPRLFRLRKAQGMREAEIRRERKTEKEIESIEIKIGKRSENTEIRIEIERIETEKRIANTEIRIEMEGRRSTEIETENIQLEIKIKIRTGREENRPGHREIRIRKRISIEIDIRKDRPPRQRRVLQTGRARNEGQWHFICKRVSFINRYLLQEGEAWGTVRNVVLLMLVTYACGVETFAHLRVRNSGILPKLRGEADLHKYFPFLPLHE